MHRRWYAFALILIVLMHATALAQDTAAQECDIDLSDESAMIADADEALNSGDQDAALATLTDAKGALEEILSQCSLAAEVTFETAVYAAPGGNFSLEYPANWTVNTAFSDADQGTQAYFATSAETMRALATPTPALASGEQAVTMIVLPSVMFGVAANTPPGEALDQVVETLVPQLPAEMNLGDVSEISVGDISARRIALEGESFNGAMLVFPLADDNLAVFFALAAPGELDALETTIAQMVTSFEAS
ncbi:MAG: hypothetical protein KC547_08690 [Anaerolineae bacterium]|nr:hypothetical protein [Anaerolineae bacterium]